MMNLTATGGFLLLWRTSVFWCTLGFKEDIKSAVMLFKKINKN